MNRLFSSLLYTLLPGRCIICRAQSQRKIDLCSACEEELPLIHHPCIQCGMPCPSRDDNNIICGHCTAKPPQFARTFCAFAYISPINLLISEFKNGHNLVTGKVMSQVLARRYKQNIKDRPAPHLLLPVPLHKKRLKLRGFNQAIEISQVIGDICQIPTNTKICTRIKDTQDQKSLTAKERKGNINHAFAVNRDLDGYRIAIIDDVITTGTTVASLAGLLIKRGAISVEVIALARTPLR
jgi:ComF family protein